MLLVPEESQATCPDDLVQRDSECSDDEVDVHHLTSAQDLQLEAISRDALVDQIQEVLGAADRSPVRSLDHISDQEPGLRSAAVPSQVLHGDEVLQCRRCQGHPGLRKHGARTNCVRVERSKEVTAKEKEKEEK